VAPRVKLSTFTVLKGARQSLAKLLPYCFLLRHTLRLRYSGQHQGPLVSWIRYNNTTIHNIHFDLKLRMGIVVIIMLNDAKLR
jgi:hypothetical protein